MKIELSLGEVVGMLALLMAPSPMGFIKNKFSKGENMLSPIVESGALKNAREFKAFAAALVKGGQAAKKDDGKFTANDFVHFGPALLLMPGAIADITQVKDIKVDEVVLLAGEIASDLGLDGDIAADIQDALEVIQRIIAVVGRHRVVKAIG